jgi:hypothetical protein
MRLALGIGLLLVVVTIWVASAELTEVVARAVVLSCLAVYLQR